MSDSSGGAKDLLSDMDLSSQPPSHGAGLSKYAADLSDLDPMFTSSIVSPQSPPECLISLSPPPTPTPTKSAVTPSKELLMQFDSLMLPSPSSLPQPALIDLDADATEVCQIPTEVSPPGTAELTSDSTTADLSQSDAFDTPPSSPSWPTDQTLTPAKLSTPDSSPAGSPAILPPAPDHFDSPNVTVLAPTVPPRPEPSEPSDAMTAPLPDSDDVMQELAPASPDNNIVVAECAASPTKTVDTSSSNVALPPPDTSCTAHITGSMLLIHGMEESVSLEKMNLHFSCYRASIHSVELAQDPANSDLKMGVVKFHFPMQAHKLQQEFQMLPISGRTHKVTATACEIPVPLPPLCPPDDLDELEGGSSVMEGAPVPRERRPRPVSPASLEFSPCEGARTDPQRVPKDRFPGRTSSKFQRLDPLPQLDDGRPPVHAVMIRNILKGHDTRQIKDFAEKWWGDQILSMKPVPDKNSEQHIILYINLHSKGLPEVIAKKLREERLVVPPMQVEVRFNTPLSSILKVPPKPKRRREVPPTQQEVSPLGSHPPQDYQPPPYHQEEYPNIDPDPTPPQDYTPSAPPRPTVDETILILDQVVPPVNDNTMSEYFRDFLQDASGWESAQVGNLNRVKVVFSNRRVALQAKDSLANVPFNGSNVQFSLENTSPPNPPPPATPPTPIPSAPPHPDPITESPQAYLIISGIDSDVTAEEFERDTFLKRYKDSYSDLRIQTNHQRKEKRIRVSFHSRDAIIAAESALLQCNFRGKQVDVKIQVITQGETSPKQEHVPPPQPPPPPLSNQNFENFVPSNDCKVVVMSIPPNTKESEIGTMFSQFGRIMSDVELKPMSQNSNLLQCKVVFDNPESAYNAVRERDRKTFKGHILNVKVLSELIQSEPIEREVTQTEADQPIEREVTQTEADQPIEREVTQTEASPVEPPPQTMVSKEVTVELMMYVKTKFPAEIESFQSEGTVSYDEEKKLLTINHPDPQALLRFEKIILNEVDEAIESLDKGEMELLNSPVPSFGTYIEMVCGALKEAKQIDYMMNHFPNQIHIFGEKLSVSVAMKNLRQALYSQLAIECPLMFFFRKFPSMLHEDPDQIELSDLLVRIKSSQISIEQCKKIRDSMQKVVSSCCYQPLNMSQKYLKPAHVFITRNDLSVCLLIQTSEGKFLDHASKTTPGAICYICGLREHVESLAPVLDNPIEERLSISQKAMKKLTKTTEKGTILLERFESRSKVCISLDKQTIIISGFILEDVKAMVEELQKKFEDVSIVLKEPTLNDLQKSYLLNAQTLDPNLVSQIFQDLECNFQLKVEVQNDQIMLSGDQDSLLSCENNPQQLCEFFQRRLPIKNFHKVVDKVLAEHFLKLICTYLQDLSSQECYFIFHVKKPQEMTNRPGSSDVQIWITAELSIIALIEPKIKELRPKCEFVKLSKNDLNIVQNAAADKLERFAKSEYFHIIPDKQACKLRVLSIGISSRTAQVIVDSALCDQTDSRDLAIHAMLAFYIREKKLIHSLANQFQCELKIIEVKENNSNSKTCIRMDGKRDSLDKVNSHIASLDKDLTSKSVEIKFPSKKFCTQFQREILEVIESMKGESDIIIDTRNITGRDPTSIRESTVKFISTSNAGVHQLSNSFLELIKFEQSAPKPLADVQQKKLVSDMLNKLSDLCSKRHYYIELSRENVIIKALNYFKAAIPCGEQDIQPYLEISACDYRVDNLVILNLLHNQPSREKLNSLGIDNSVNIKPPDSPDQPFKLEGKNENVQIVLGEIKKYVAELWKYLGSCEVSVHFPLEALQSDPEITRFLSGLGSPEINFLCEFPKQSSISGSQDLIACYEHTLNTQILTIELRRGDITKLKVDAIVNAANDNLDHCGGVALAISEAGGPVIQQSSTDYVKKHGKVPVSFNVILPPGNLSCQSVIHAVGPIWDPTSQNRVMNELGNCVFNICERANEADFSSIAMPTISAGIFAFPVNLSTSIIIEAISHFFTSKPFYSLKKVILIDIQDQVLNQFQTLCNKQFRLSPSSNVPTKPHVPLRKKASPATPQLIFEWQENDGSWHSYSEVDHKKIRAAYLANPEGTAQTSRSKYTYTLNFVSMVQFNDQTQVQRKIRVTKSTHPSQQAPAPASSPPSWKDIASEKIQFFGPRDKLGLIKQQFNTLIQSLVKRTEFPVICQMQDLVRIMDSCKTDYVKFDLEESDDGAWKVQIEGYSKEVMESERNITAELLKLLQVQNPVIEPPPNHWKAHSSNEICKLVTLPPVSSEYREVVTKFQSTLPKKSIVRVERIQSTWLWTRYQQDKQRIVQKSASGANEMSVYHGTSTNDPVLIYKGTQGFDHRFAGGMWGMASYFAVNASYSDNGYAHTLPDGSKQLFSVKICAGDVIDLPPDGKLRLPPPKNQPATFVQPMPAPQMQPAKMQVHQMQTPNMQLFYKQPPQPLGQPPQPLQPPSLPQPISQGAVAPQFADDRYDTVSGTTNGSKVYMIYENGRAYPEYLITYR